jgi:hypothetical protein
MREAADEAGQKEDAGEAEQILRLCRCAHRRKPQYLVHAANAALAVAAGL